MVRILRLKLDSKLNSEQFLATHFHNSEISEVESKMSNQRRLINENVSESVINITLENLKDLQLFETEEFSIRGHPWHLHFKRTKNDANNDSLGVNLQSNFEHQSNNTYIIANCEINLLSWKPHVKAHCFKLHPHQYSLKYKYWGIPSFILWNQLIDPEKGYVHDDKCKLKAKITATPVQDHSKKDWMEFETINSCDNCLQRKFRMKINKFSEFFGVASPAIIFDDVSFNIEVFRYQNALFIRMYKRGPNTCSASCSFKLISFGANIEPLKVEYKNQKFNANANYQILAEWEQLIDPLKNFIQNDSFVIEANMIAELDKPNAKRRKTCEANEFVLLSCPICFENLKDRPISMIISCGHTFCTACGTDALQKSRKCPTCHAAATLKSLRRCYLPQ